VFDVQWTEIVDGGVASGAVIEDFDVREDRLLGFKCEVWK